MTLRSSPEPDWSGLLPTPFLQSVSPARALRISAARPQSSRPSVSWKPGSPRHGRPQPRRGPGATSRTETMTRKVASCRTARAAGHRARRRKSSASAVSLSATVRSFQLIGAARDGLRGCAMARAAASSKGRRPWPERPSVIPQAAAASIRAAPAIPSGAYQREPTVWSEALL
jgi:hypothetical protein